MIGLLLALLHRTQIGHSVNDPHASAGECGEKGVVAPHQRERCFAPLGIAQAQFRTTDKTGVHVAGWLQSFTDEDQRGGSARLRHHEDKMGGRHRCESEEQEDAKERLFHGAPLFSIIRAFTD
jgi:hypothetical protein